MPQDTTTIDPAWSVNETIARYPSTIAVFNRFGVDTCCGGGAAIQEAAYRDGIDREMLLEALRQAVASA